MRKVSQILMAATITVATVARAEPPTPDEAKKVYEFMEHGQGQGIVLEDARLCAEIPKTGEHKSECTELTDGVPAGSKVYVWVAYLVPKGDSITDVSVQVKDDDKIRETKDFDKLDGKGYLAHTWTMFTAKKPGVWSADIVQGDKTLKTLKIKVGG